MDTDAPGQYRVFLVTDSHVVDGLRASIATLEATSPAPNTSPKSATAVVRFQPGPGQVAREAPLDMNAWTQDKSLDVAVAPINANALKALGVNSLDFFTADTSATRDKVKQLGMSEGDGVFIVGFPNLGPNTTISGNEDFVIVRWGTIARISDFEQGLTERYLVDGFVFPGIVGAQW